MKLRDIFLLCLFCFFLTGCVTIPNNLGPSGNFPHRPPTPGNPVAIKPKENEVENNDNATDDARKAAGKGKDVPPTSNATCVNNGKAGDNCDFPAWLNVAMSHLGLHEGGNGKPNKDKQPTIDYRGKEGYNQNGESIQVKKFHENADWSGQNGYYTFDSAAAWCGSFVHWCLTKTKNPKTGKNYEGLEKNAIKSQAWLEYGENVDKNNPFLGAIMVLSQPNLKHVTFLVGLIEQKTTSKDNKVTIKRIYIGLGGNQGNSVKLSPYSSSAVKAFRKPHGYIPCKKHYNLSDTWWTNEYVRNKPSKKLGTESTR